MTDNKTRHLSILNYFEQLQREYVVTYLRSKIYTKEENRKYYEDILVYKKSKIIDIGKRNDLPTIFNSNIEYEKFYKSIIDFGIPNFEYRDAQQKDKMFSRDLNNYFSANNDIKYKDQNGNITTGKIMTFDFHKMVVKIKLKGEQNGFLQVLKT